MMSLALEQPADAALGVLSHFRVEFYDCLYTRADALFELTDAVLCSDGPVTSLVELTLTAEHRRGHGAMYDAVNHGWLEPRRLRRLLASAPLPRAADGRIVLAVDVSNWLRPDAPTSPELLFCHVYGRGRSADQFIPGWPYSFVAALETGRTSWTAVLDAIRLGPCDDATAVTAAQLREVVTRLVHAGQWRPGDADILIVMDTGYDVTRLAYVLADLPVELVGRLRSDRVMLRDAGPRRSTPRGGDGALPAVALGCVFPDLVGGRDELLAYVDGADGQVGLAPGQAGDLAAAQGAEDHQVEDRVKPMFGDGVEERSGLFGGPDHDLARLLACGLPAGYPLVGPHQRLGADVLRQDDALGPVL